MNDGREKPDHWALEPMTRLDGSAVSAILGYEPDAPDAVVLHADRGSHPFSHEHQGETGISLLDDSSLRRHSLGVVVENDLGQG